MNTQAVVIFDDKKEQTGETAIQTEQFVDTRWLDYFRPEEAYDSLKFDIGNLPGSKTPEKHTMRVYASGIAYWFEWAGINAMPTGALLLRYITHLRHEKEWGKDGKNRGLTVTTIGSKYLAPLRKYINFLMKQSITMRTDKSPLSGDDRILIDEYRMAMRAALDVKTPVDDRQSNLAPLYRHGERLTTLQVQKLYDSCNVNKLAGLRDFAFLYLGFTTGMRIAEIQRITLNKIKQGESCYLIHVRRKRGNRDPVPLDSNVYNIILAYVEHYNSKLDDDDPRRIGADTPIWQGIQHNDTAFPVGYQKIKPSQGMSAPALRAILKKRCKLAGNGNLREFPQIAPHDMRRTVAAIAHAGGMGIPEIQALLGHKNGGVTLGYIGKPPQPEKSLITNLPSINWNIPAIPDISRQMPLAAG